MLLGERHTGGDGLPTFPGEHLREASCPKDRKGCCASPASQRRALPRACAASVAGARPASQALRMPRPPGRSPAGGPVLARQRPERGAGRWPQNADQEEQTGPTDTARSPAGREGTKRHTKAGSRQQPRVRTAESDPHTPRSPVCPSSATGQSPARAGRGPGAREREAPHAAHAHTGHPDPRQAARTAQAEGQCGRRALLLAPQARRDCSGEQGGRGADRVVGTTGSLRCRAWHG